MCRDTDICLEKNERVILKSRAVVPRGPEAGRCRRQGAHRWGDSVGEVVLRSLTLNIHRSYCLIMLNVLKYEITILTQIQNEYGFKGFI